jgi:predicted RNase H-like HicB family nuclease
MQRPSSYNLTVLVTKQGRRFVAYSPALDISTSGTTEKKARERFEELVEIYFEELVASGNLANVLSELGWSKKASRWNPPQEISKKTVAVRVLIPA